MSVKKLLEAIGETEEPDDNVEEAGSSLLKYLDENPSDQQYNTAYDSAYSAGTVLDSKYDKGTVYGTNINENRANEQTIADKWVNGLGKALSAAFTSTGEGLGVLIGGLPAILSGNSDLAFKNPVVNFFNEAQDVVDKSLPNYQSEAEQNNSLLEDLTTANFWSDKFLRGAGIMAGNIIPATSIMKAGKAFKTAILASKAGELGIASNLIKEVPKLNRIAKIIDGSSALTASVVGRVGESALEANDVYDQVVNDLIQKREAGLPEFQLTDEQIENRAKQARMNTFGANMLLAIPDTYQMMKLFGNFGTTTKALNKFQKNASGLFEKTPLTRFEKVMSVAKEPFH
jgi:hypothetical protein